MQTNRMPAGAGPATSRNDKADGANVGQVGEVGEVVKRNKSDSAKDEATAVARAALLGIEVYSTGPAVWKLRHARGADIGVVRGHQALAAAVAGFEAAHHDVAMLVRRLAGGRP
jgi:hypothetical protein